MSELGEFIANARNAKGYSLAELKKLSGLSDSAILRWESGDTMPRVDNLQRLLAVLGYKIQIVKK